MAEAAVIHAESLRKLYGPTRALDDVGFNVPAGSICGFLGKNGAGKTTTIKILLGMARATAGIATVFGLPVSDREASVAIRRRTAFAGEDQDLLPYMTVDELLAFTAAFYPRWNRDAEDRYLRRFEIPRQTRISALSRGTRTRLSLVLAVCRGAELLILDEPTAGLDPVVREDVLQALVRCVAESGCTVFFSSHQIAEVEQIADHVVIVDRGRTIVEGGLDDVRERFCRLQLIFDGPAPEATFRGLGVTRVRREGRLMTLFATGPREPLIAEARQLSPIAVDVLPVTLKDVFLETVATEN